MEYFLTQYISTIIQAGKQTKQTVHKQDILPAFCYIPAQAEHNETGERQRKQT